MRRLVKQDGLRPAVNREDGAAIIDILRDADPELAERFAARLEEAERSPLGDLAVAYLSTEERSDTTQVDRDAPVSRVPEEEVWQEISVQGYLWVNQWRLVELPDLIRDMGRWAIRQLQSAVKQGEVIHEDLYSECLRTLGCDPALRADLADLFPHVRKEEDYRAREKAGG